MQHVYGFRDPGTLIYENIDVPLKNNFFPQYFFFFFLL